MKRLLVAVPLLLLAPTVPAHAEGYPAPDGYVLDEDHFLGPGVETRLERQLAAYDRRTTNQVAVAVVHTFGGMTPEDYGLGLFNRWGVGTEAKDNGVLLVLAVDDRQSRLQVGRGLGDVLTDDEAQTVLDDVVAPAAADGDLDSAVVRAVTAVRAQLGETPARTPVAAAPAGDPFRGGTAEPVYADDVVQPDGGTVPDGGPYPDGPTTAFPVDNGPGGPSFLGFGVIAVLVAAVVAFVRRLGGSSGGSGGTWTGSDDDTWSGARRAGFLGGALGSGAFGRGGFGRAGSGSGSSGWGGSDSGSSSSSSVGGSDSGSSGSSGGSFGGGSSDGGGASGSW